MWHRYDYSLVREIHRDGEAALCAGFGPTWPRRWEEHNSHHVHHSIGWRYLCHHGHVLGSELDCHGLVRRLPVHLYHGRDHDPVGKDSYCWLQLFRVRPFGWLGYVFLSAAVRARSISIRIQCSQIQLICSS